MQGTPLYVEEINGFTFIEYTRFRPETLIISLPDVGLVGAITGLHITRELNLKDVVGIDSYNMLPPVTVIINGQPRHPVRIYSTHDGKIAVLLTDVPFTPPAIVAFSIALVRYARSRGVKTLVSVTGIGNPARFELEKPNLYIVSNNEKLQKEISDRVGAKDVKSGILVGPYSIILKEASRVDLDNIVLLADSFVDIPDPEAAIVVIEALSKLYGLKVNIDRLRDEADKIKMRLRELMRETKSLMAKMGKSMEYRPSLMYT